MWLFKRPSLIIGIFASIIVAIGLGLYYSKHPIPKSVQDYVGILALRYWGLLAALCLVLDSFRDILGAVFQETGLWPLSVLVLGVEDEFLASVLRYWGIYDDRIADQSKTVKMVRGRRKKSIMERVYGLGSENPPQNWLVWNSRHQILVPIEQDIQWRRQIYELETIS